MHPLRICVITSDFPPRIGGIATFSAGLVTALSRSEEIASVRVLAIQGSTRSIETSDSKLTIVRIPKRGPLRMFLDIARELFHQRRQIDVLHAANIFPVGFFVCVLGMFLHKPVVATFHGTDVLTHEGSPATKRAKSFTLRHASAAVGVSASTRHLAAEHWRIPEDRLRVIYYPMPPYERHAPVLPIRETYGYSQNDVIVLSVAHLVKRKGVDDVIRAFGRVFDPRVKLVVVGDGPERDRLTALIDELYLADRVRLVGRVDDIDSFYHHADLFVLASFFISEEGDVEGLGIVLLEAAQHGLPVIGTKSGGIPEALREGESGFLVAERDVPALAEKINLLGSDPVLRKRMGEAGKRFVAERFNPRRIMEEYASLYRSMFPR